MNTMMKRKKPSSPTQEAAANRPTKKPSKDVFYAEEELAQGLDPKECVTKYKSCCAQLRDLAKEIYEAKLGKKNQVDLTECMAPVLQMKELNRGAQFCMKRIREMTHEKKTQIDQHHLKRQNLMYEVMHLKKEISRCLEFRSKHEDINLIPVEEFYAEAPEEISRPDVTKTDMHAQTLARLSWDLEQRKELAKQLKSADESMEVERREIQAKKDYLNGLLPRLKEIMETTRPLQDYMDISFSKEMEQTSIASLLPSPLYTLFVEVKAYSQARDPHVQVSVDGDVEEARAVRHLLQEVRSADRAAPAERLESESEEEEAGHGGDAAGDGGGVAADKRSGSPGSRKKGRRRRRGTKSLRSAEEEALEHLLRLHPLSVLVQVRIRNDVVLRMEFCFAMTLRVVTAKVKLDLPAVWSDDSSFSEDLLHPLSMLSHVYPHDSGQASGLHVLRHEMQRAGVASLGPHAARLGSPYVWVQRLAGLDLLPTVVEAGREEAGVDLSNIPPPNLDVAFDHSVECFARIKRRITSRLALIRELAAIERNDWRLTEAQQKLVPLRQTSRLRGWRKIGYDDVKNLPQAHKLLSGDLLHPYDFFYTATLERETPPRVRATVHVVIPVDYPTETPVCLLALPSPVPGGAEMTNDNCLQIQELETVVNCCLGEFAIERGEWTLGNGYLACQLQRLMACLDVFVENEWAEVAGDDAALRDRHKARSMRVLRVAKFPSRRMPYKYSQVFDTFVQR